MISLKWRSLFSRIIGDEYSYNNKYITVLPFVLVFLHCASFDTLCALLGKLNQATAADLTSFPFPLVTGQHHLDTH